MGNIVVQKNNREGSGSGSASLAIDVSGSMMRQQQKNNNQNQVHAASAITTPISGGAITPDELAKLMNFKNEVSRKEDGALYGPSDWETSASEVRIHSTSVMFIIVFKHNLSWMRCSTNVTTYIYKYVIKYTGRNR